MEIFGRIGITPAVGVHQPRRTMEIFGRIGITPAAGVHQPQLVRRVRATESARGFSGP